MDEELVYFRFEGSPALHITAADVSLPKAALAAFPNSVLTRLADASWRKSGDNETGKDSRNPVITQPLNTAACGSKWYPCLAQFIAQAYQWKLADGKDAPLHMPGGIDVNHMSSVLDYYGIDVDIKNEVSLELLHDLDHIRYKLDIKDDENVRKAKAWIVESIKQDPKRESHFAFVGNGQDNMVLLDNLGPDFVIVGEVGTERGVHSEWVESQRLRDRLVQLMKVESCLQARFLEEEYFDEKNLDYHQMDYPSSLKREYCLFAEMDFDDQCGTPFMCSEEVAILQVSIPRSEE